MKKAIILGIAAACLVTGLSAGNVLAAQPAFSDASFETKVIIEGLENPWNMCLAPDGWLWVSERTGKRITRVNPETGEKKAALTIADAYADEGHQGVLGFALAPGFLEKDNPNYFYVFYTYMDGQEDYKKIVRFEYDAASETLKNPKAILEKIPAGDDHEGGRVVYGPDGKLYVSLGELGHNQFGNACKPIEAQRLPTQKEVDAKDGSAYVGKVLRVNLDGSVPADNPALDGVKSHVFTYGHRNPQGLVFVGKNLYECEHGPSTDDELNLLVAGGNYGWPHVAGFQDDEAYVYANYSAAKDCQNVKWDANVIPEGVPVQKESEWQTPDNFVPPLKTFWTVRTGYPFHDADKYGGLAYAKWPTVAPSSIIYYPEDGPIVPLRNSILMTTLKTGMVIQIPLTLSKDNVQGTVYTHFKTPNRYRTICFSKDLSAIYLTTDSYGTATDYDLVPTNKVQNPGAIIMLKYNPAVK